MKILHYIAMHSLIILMLLLPLTIIFTDEISEAKKYEEHGDINKALDLYKKWMEKNIESIDLFKILQHTADIEVNPQLEITILKKHLVHLSNEEKHTILNRLANLESFIGNVSDAQKHFEACSFSIKGRRDFESLLSSALLLFEIGNFKKANAQTNAILESSDNNILKTKANILVSRILAVQGKHNESLKVLTLSTHTNFQHLPPEYLLWINEISEITGNMELAKKAAEQLSVSYPNSPEYMLIKKEISYYPEPVHCLGLLNLKSEPGSEKIEENESKEESIIMIQIASFLNKENAEYQIKEMIKSGFNAVIVERNINQKIYYRVVLPNIPSTRLQEQLILLKDKGFEGYPVFND